MPTPSDCTPVRIGIAGLGRAGMFHVERIGLRDDFYLAAVYDDCMVARERAQSGALTVAETWDGFLHHAQTDVVLLATPPALHATQAIQALAAGKHVVIETPMCLNLAEAEAIAEMTRRTGRSVTVAHSRRCDDDFRTAKEALSSGELGQLWAVKYINWHYNPSCRPDAAASPSSPAADQLTRLAPVNWRDHASTGGGVLWEFGIHCFDQLLQLAGRPAESVYARLFSASADAESDDAFLAIVNFSGRLLAHVEVSRVAPAPLDTGWMIGGQSGSYSASTQYIPNSTGEVVDLPMATNCGMADEFYGQLTRHYRDGDRNPIPIEEARGTIALIEAIRKSAQCGEVVPVDQ